MFGSLQQLARALNCVIFFLCDFFVFQTSYTIYFFLIKLPFVLLHKKEELGIFQEEIEMHKIRRYIDIF